MCVIIWAPKGEIPTDHITNAMLCHQDGWGFAVATGAKVVVYKTCDFKEFLKAWFKRLAGPVLFHARKASHGRVTQANCHPFKLKNHPLVVAHNGIIPCFGHATLSDTRDFLDRVVEPMPEWFLEEEGIKRSMSLAIGRSKMVFLDREANATILNEEFGLWKDGRWYSNLTAFSTTSNSDYQAGG